jgi:hypothetical protein
VTEKCRHAWRPKSIEYGRYIGKGADRYQEMLHTRVCKNCGREEHESDRYFGNDRNPGYTVLFDSEGRQLW